MNWHYLRANLTGFHEERAAPRRLAPDFFSPALRANPPRLATTTPAAANGFRISRTKTLLCLTR